MTLDRINGRALGLLRKENAGLQWFASLGVFSIGVLILTNWPLYQYTILGGPIPLVYYAIGPSFAVVLTMVHPGRRLSALREPLVFWFILYLIAGLLWLLISATFSEVEMALWRIRLLEFAIFSAALMLASMADRAHIATMILACALLASINNWLDFLFPFSYVPIGSEYSNPGRGAGLFINANEAGGALIAMTIGVSPFLKRRYRGLVLLIMLFGVYPTFSRAAFMLAVLVAMLAISLGQINRRQLAPMGLLAPIIFLLGLSLYKVGISSDEINLANVEGRIDYFLTGGEIADDSALERKDVALLAWRMISENPFIGNGLGSTQILGLGRGTHNMYLSLAAEQGVAGVLLYLIFIVLILRKGWRMFDRHFSQQTQDVGSALLCMGAYFAFMGLFSHNLLDQPLGLFVLALLVAAANEMPYKFRKDSGLYSQSYGV